MALVIPDVGVSYGGAVQWCGVGDEGGCLMMGGMGEYYRATEAASEKSYQLSDERIVLHCLDGMIKIPAACFKGCDFFEVTLALAAAAVVKTKVGDALGIAGLGQGDLFGRVAVGQQAVASDDHRGIWPIG